MTNEEAIETLKSNYPDKCYELLCEAVDTAIKSLENEPKRGHWIRLDMHRGMEQYRCSVCEAECYVPECLGEPIYSFCPFCGNPMDEVA